MKITWVIFLVALVWAIAMLVGYRYLTKHRIVSHRKLLAVTLAIPCLGMAMGAYFFYGEKFPGVSLGSLCIVGGALAALFVPLTYLKAYTDHRESKAVSRQPRLPWIR